MTVIAPARPGRLPIRLAVGWDVVGAARGGDVDAFAEIWRVFHPQIRAFVAGRVPSWALAEDLSGDVMVRALRHIRTVADPGDGRDVGAWLMTIARNRVADHYRRDLKRDLKPVALLGDLGDLDTADVAPGPEDLALTAAVGREVRAALLALTPLQRQVVELRYLDELSTAETAALMSLELGAVKSLLGRALAAMRRQLLSAGDVSDG